MRKDTLELIVRHLKGILKALEKEKTQEKQDMTEEQ
jgi:hypothetical protein